MTTAQGTDVTTALGIISLTFLLCSFLFASHIWFYPISVSFVFIFLFVCFNFLLFILCLIYIMPAPKL